MLVGFPRSDVRIYCLALQSGERERMCGSATVVGKVFTSQSARGVTKASYLQGPILQIVPQHALR